MSQDSLNTGRQIGGYTLTKFIKRGVQAEAHQAESESCPIAVVKLFKPKCSGDQNIEVNAYSLIRHKNVLRMISHGAEGSETYLVLKYAEKGTLFENLVSHGKFPTEVARMVFKQMIEGLGEIQNQGVSHNDLHNDNIFLTNKYKVKIADFGKATGPLQFIPPDYKGPRSRSKNSHNVEICDVFVCGFNILSLATKQYNLINFAKKATSKNDSSKIQMSFGQTSAAELT